MVSKLADRLWRTAQPALMRRWRQDESGATSIEFAIVAMPFVLLLFGLMSVCLYYFADFSIENATWQAARAMRTGQLQQSQGAYAGAVTNADRKQIFKKAFCDRAPLFLDCITKVVVIVQSNTGFGSITQPNCASNGVLINDSHGRLQHGRRQLRGPRHGLLSLGSRRQAADVQSGQPAGRRAPHAGVVPPSAPSPTIDGRASLKRQHPDPNPDQTENAMPTLSLSDLGARASALLHRWRADATGVAAVEFAFIVPIMGVMFIGAVELSQAIIVDRRVTQIASSTADLVARAETTISQSDITDIMKAGSFIMSPYALNPLQIVVREFQSSPTSATTPSNRGRAPSMVPAAR